MEAALLLFVIVAGYFIPTIVALKRNHHRTGQIFTINLLTGWLIIGWIIAFVMAVGPVDQRTVLATIGSAQRSPELPAPVTAIPKRIACWKCGQLISQVAWVCWNCAAKAADAPPPTPTLADKACPFCRSMIPGDAQKCRSCGEWVVPEAERRSI